jgi:2-polyprenyl-6-methoxyphenol hydroxylase-like FAD-dependent oxidoreductase
MYDAIIIGGRCAGASTAMLLARAGHRVLLIDRATFPSDTISTHIIWPSGVERLERWGLEPEIAGSGCPPIHDVTLDAGEIVLNGRPTSIGGVGQTYCVRRTILDSILVEAAAKAGVDVRLGTAVSDLVFDQDGAVTGIKAGGAIDSARIVIGADGLHSLVAKAVVAAEYETKPSLTCCYYSYWSDVDVDGIRICQRPGRAFGYAPTNEDLTMVVAFAPVAEFREMRADVEGHFLATLELAPEVGAAVRAGHREDRFHGTADLPNFFRVPFGPGWALVGDAGYHRDPLTAQGISDAFRDAELLAAALDAGLRGPRPMDAALVDYQSERDAAAMPMYELTTDMASLEPPPPELAALLGAIDGRPEEISQFLGVFAGSVPVAEFFAPDNIERIMSA